MNDTYFGKRILVTGASGFIGSHLVRALKKLGAVVGVTEHLYHVESGYDECYHCDLKHYEQIRYAIVHFDPEIIFHIAAEAIVGNAESTDLNTFTTNVLGTVNLLHAVKEHKSNNLHGVIIASTDKVYGRSGNLPYDEEHPLLGAKQIYEASKNCEDVVAQAYAHSYNIPVAITRFGNVYGPGDMHMSRLIPGTIQSYLEGKQPFIRSDGQHYRDFVYIDDVVGGYLKLGLYRLENEETNPMIFNFGTGIPSRVLDVVNMISGEFTNAKIPKIDFGAEDEIKYQYVDGRLAFEVFGWKSVTPLRVGIPLTVQWYKEHYVKSD